MKQRNLTVSYRSETRIGSSPYAPSRYITVPALSLKGKWLEELGFEIGTKVCVECGNGVLKIRKIDCKK